MTMWATRWPFVNTTTSGHPERPGHMLVPPSAEITLPVM